MHSGKGMNIHAVLEDGERLFSLLVKVLINGKYHRCVWKLDEILIFRALRPSFFLPTILNIVVSNFPSNSTTTSWHFFTIFFSYIW